jgi:hypothetical protein
MREKFNFTVFFNCLVAGFTVKESLRAGWLTATTGRGDKTRAKNGKNGSVKPVLREV